MVRIYYTASEEILCSFNRSHPVALPLPKPKQFKPNTPVDHKRLEFVIIKHTFPPTEKHLHLLLSTNSFEGIKNLQF